MAAAFSFTAFVFLDNALNSPDTLLE